MKKHKLLGVISILVVGLLAVGCTSNEISKDEVVDTQPQVELLEIADLSDAWDTVLNNSTNAFIGGHPIDEGFLSYVTGTYGDEVMQEIASYAHFESPDIWYKMTGRSIHVLWYDYCKLTGLENYTFDNIYEFDTASSEEIVLDFTGDLTLAQGVATTVYMDHQVNGISDCFSKNLLKEMNSVDIMMINNEFAYTNRGEAIPGKAYTFRADPSRVNLLDELGVDLVSIANNHVYDYGPDGMYDTLATLDEKGLPYAGAGYNLDDAMRPVYLICNGQKIAICAATQIERSYTYTKQATADMPGVLKTLKSELFVKEIKEARENADKVIVFVHWGTEGTMRYGSDQVTLARSFVEAGADAIIGGHTHCLQAVEYIDDVPVYYSLGNFFFSSTSNMPANYDTGMAQLRIKADGNIEAYFLPCKFTAGHLTLLDNEDGSDIYNTLNSISSTAYIDETGMISKIQTN